MKFTEAFEIIRNDESRYMYLEEFINTNTGIRMQTPNEHSKMTRPYLYITNGVNNVPYVVSNIDLFSNDWIVGFGNVGDIKNER